MPFLRFTPNDAYPNRPCPSFVGMGREGTNGKWACFYPQKRHGLEIKRPQHDRSKKGQ